MVRYDKMRILVVGLLVALSGCGPDRITVRCEEELQPVIQFVDDFIEKNGRLPSETEFHAVADNLARMVVLRDKHHRYAVSLGAKSDLDYMVGIWRADWYHYYKSWDKQFVNASDEPLIGP